jgi:predicted  nucleic acid-binding Zn-ribbon protein
MYPALKAILGIQEKDVKMIRLMRLKRERQKELNNLDTIKEDFRCQLEDKKSQILELKQNIKLMEAEVEAADEKVKHLEGNQAAVKKVEEFNALSREIAAAEREKAGREQQLSDLIDKLNDEEDTLERLNETVDTTIESSLVYEQEVKDGIKMINAEGRTLKGERDKMVEDADPEVLKIYEKLLKNKKDRVVVPIENRTCSGCHIVLTAQQENLVRKGERPVFCEHCSRILYWQESEELLDTQQATKRRRRKVTN